VLLHVLEIKHIVAHEVHKIKNLYQEEEPLGLLLLSFCTPCFFVLLNTNHIIENFTLLFNKQHRLVTLNVYNTATF